MIMFNEMYIYIYTASLLEIFKPLCANAYRAHFSPNNSPSSAVLRWDVWPTPRASVYAFGGETSAKPRVYRRRLIRLLYCHTPASPRVCLTSTPAGRMGISQICAIHEPSLPPNSAGLYACGQRNVGIDLQRYTTPMSVCEVKHTKSNCLETNGHLYSDDILGPIGQCKKSYSHS